MAFAMRVGKVGHVEMRVALGGVDAVVAEQFLHVAKVRTGTKEMCRERMTERVRRDAFCDARLPCSLLNDPHDASITESRSLPSAPSDEEERLHVRMLHDQRTSERHVTLHRFDCRLADRHETLLRSFAMTHEHHAIREINIREVESAHFSATKTGRVHQLEQRSIAKTARRLGIRSFEQSSHLRFSDHVLRLPSSTLFALDGDGWIDDQNAVVHYPREEAMHGIEPLATAARG